MVKIDHGITIKTDHEIEIMRQGGKKLAYVKNELEKNIKEGVRASQIEELATKLIKKVHAKPSFKMVENYYWSTCVNVNQGLVHGIPTSDIVFKKGDVVSVDVGIYYKGFHTDTSITYAINPDKLTKHFLEIGKLALKRSIAKCIEGNRIYDLSKAIEDTLKKSGYTPIRALVGHGVGKFLHEEPQIPCFVQGKRRDSPEIKNGMVFAIEVMYSMGKNEVVLDADGWTISTRDGKIAALFEETVATRKSGPIVLTELN